MITYYLYFFSQISLELIGRPLQETLVAIIVHVPTTFMGCWMLGVDMQLIDRGFLAATTIAALLAAWTNLSLFQLLKKSFLKQLRGFSPDAPLEPN